MLFAEIPFGVYVFLGFAFAGLVLQQTVKNLIGIASNQTVQKGILYWLFKR